MKIAFFDTHAFERGIFEEENAAVGSPHEISFFQSRLLAETAPVARGFPTICVFVNDTVTREIVEDLAKSGLRLIALRSAGFNHVDLSACEDAEVRVVRVPAYSPNAVAEHAVALLMTLNRKIHRAYARVRELNFSLEGLVGFDIHGKTVGVIGTGKIGASFVRIMSGFGCRVLAYDPVPNVELKAKYGVEYRELDEIYRESDIISLHVPLNPSTRHMVDSRAFDLMKRGGYLINTSRGALVDTKALVDALKSGHLGAAGLDVYEEEEGIFFFDLSGKVLLDDTLARLLTFPNVVVTAHQAFLTSEALHQIASTTIGNISVFESGRELCNEVHVQRS